MSDSPRDPRTDPKAGDVLETVFRRRAVTAVYTYASAAPKVEYRSGAGVHRSSLSSWKAWSRNAKVLETAP